MPTPAASSEQTRFSALLLEGLEHYRRGEMLEAVRSWEEAYRLEPTNLRAREFLRSALERIHAQLRSSTSKPPPQAPAGGAVDPWADGVPATSPLPTPPLGIPPAPAARQAPPGATASAPPSATPIWPPPRSAPPPSAATGHPWLPQPGGARRPTNPPGTKAPSLAAVAGAVLASERIGRAGNSAKAGAPGASPSEGQRGSPPELAATTPRGLPPPEQTAPWDDGPSLALPDNAPERLPERFGDGQLARTNGEGAATRISADGPLGRTTPETGPGRSGDSGIWGIHETEKAAAPRGASAKAHQQASGAAPSPSNLAALTDRPKPSASDPGMEITAWLSGARELFGLNDFTGSLELLLKIQQRRPDDPEVVQLIRSCEENLVQMYESKMGDRERRPRVAIQPDEVIWLSLDPRAGFVLAQIDGQVTFEDLYAICGLSRLDTARILNQLLEEGVIASDPPEHSGRRSSSGGHPKVRQ